MMAVISEKIELRFWDLVIPLLTHSEIIRKIVAAAVRFYQNEKLSKSVALVFMIACGGFASGILAFTLITLLS